MGRDGDDPSIRLGARHLAGGVLAGEQPALSIVGEPVGHVAGLPERGHAVLGRPPPQVIARHVAEQQELAPGVPERPLGEEKARPEPLELDAHFLPGLPATYQSGGVTSLNTTQTASRGSWQTSGCPS